MCKPSLSAPTRPPRSWPKTQALTVSLPLPSRRPHRLRIQRLVPWHLAPHLSSIPLAHSVSHPGHRDNFSIPSGSQHSYDEALCIIVGIRRIAREVSVEVLCLTILIDVSDQKLADSSTYCNEGRVAVLRLGGYAMVARLVLSV